MSQDDDDLDESLRPLRSVWLAMPDEEPPSRGLDALLAAARVKADEMKASASSVPASVAASEPAMPADPRSPVPARTVDDDEPSLWQRFLALFQRPQMLALATIMILIGGAVFISQRRDKLDASHEASAPAASDEKRAQEIALESQTVAQSPGAAGSAASIATDPAASTPTPGLGDGLARGGADSSAAPAPEMPERDEAAGVRTAPPRAKDATGVTSDTRTVTSGKATTAKAKPKLSRNAGGAGNSPASPTDDPFEMSLADDDAESTTKGAAATPTESAKADGGEPTVRQLHDRARTAAAKGECATARALAKQIARQDALYYRANIAPDTTLAACLN